MKPPSVTLTDLDQRPDLSAAILAIFAAHVSGADHQVCGIPCYMGLAPSSATLAQAAGVLISLVDKRAVGALAICPYSEEQVTLWGPALAPGAPARTDDHLITAAREALSLSPYGSMRALVDQRNRKARVLLQAHGFTTWKDNHFYDRRLDVPATASAHVRLATRADHGAIATIFVHGFPDSDHCVPNLLKREQEGYRHYLLEEDGVIVAAAAVQDAGRRGWLKLVATSPAMRGKHLSRALIDGVLAAEAKRGTSGMGLEVLADNTPAIRLYESAGFKRKWTATILTGPV